MDVGDAYRFMPDLSPDTGNHQSLRVGTDTYVSSTDGKILRFNAIETSFLVKLSQAEHPNFAEAALAIGKDEAWAKRFFASPKFRQLSSARCAEAAAKSGLTQDRYFAYINASLLGYWLDYRGKCDVCLNQYTFFTEPESTNGIYQDECGICGSKFQVFENRRDFKPTREQMEAIKELGARVAPKIERVHHEFSRETYFFESEGDAA